MSSSAEDPFDDAILEIITNPFLILDDRMQVKRANSAFLRQFDTSAETMNGHSLYEFADRQWDIPELREMLDQLVRDGREIKNYQIKHDFAGLGRRTLSLNAGNVRSSGPTPHILLTITDRTEHERLIFDLAAQKEFAEKLVDSIREALLVLDHELCVYAANQSFFDTFKTAADDIIGHQIFELGDGQWNIPQLRELLEDILPSETSFNDFELEHDFPGLGRRIMLLNARRLDHENMILLAIRDVTQKRQTETRQQMLTSELQHRVKNILNSVRALARQTRRNSTSTDEFFEAFESRLLALSRTQDLLVRSPLADIDIEELIRTELDAFGAEDGQKFSVHGPRVSLSPRDAQALAMPIHELTTNAAKYGALSASDGRIEVEWTVDASEESDRVRLRWRELGVRIESPPSKKGFGSKVIEQTVPYMLGGNADSIFHSDGLECVLEFALSKSN